MRKSILLAAVLTAMVTAGAACGLIMFQIIVDREAQAGIDEAEVDINSIRITGIDISTINLTVNISIDNPKSVTATIEPFTIGINYGTNLLCIINIPELVIKEKQDSMEFNTTVERVETDLGVFYAFSIDFLDDWEVEITARGEITITVQALFLTVRTTVEIDRVIVLTWDD